MLQESGLDDEIAAALRSLTLEDRKRIKLELAEKDFNVVLDKRTRNGRLDAIRYPLSELRIGSQQGQEEARQKVFRAYWRLLRRVLDNRERRARAAARRRKEGA